VAREALHDRAKLSKRPRTVGRGPANDLGHLLRERAGEARNRSGRARGDPVSEQRLGSDEDVEPLDEVRRDLLERRIGDFQAGQVGGGIPQALDHVQRNRVAAHRLELVEVEGGRGAGCRSAAQMLEECIGVEAEVRGADDGDRVRAGSRGVLGQRDGVRRALGAAMDGHLQGSLRGDEDLGRSPSLVGTQENSLPRRAKSKDAVEAPVGEEAQVGLECLLVERRAFVAEGGQSCRERAVDHRHELKLRGMDALRIERDGPVLRVTLARPERRNAFDVGLIAELTSAFSQAGDARVVVLAGDGQSFSAGADVEWQRASIDLSYEENVEDAMRLYRMCEAIDSCPAPVVARVQGHALGGGSGLVACADVTVAATDAVFGFTEVRLGIIPAVISPFVLEKIGPAAARRWFLTGERFGADVALRIGLVHEISSALDDTVGEIVEAVLAGGPEAVRAAKRLARERPQGRATAEIAAARRTSEEGQAGLRAFLDKQPPPWRSASSS
jgi:methylglutaconyl-CoA hydratase